MRSSFLVPALALSLAACGAETPTPGEVRTRISSDLANVLHEAKSAADGGTINLPGRALLGYAPSVMARVVAANGNTITSGFDPDAAITWLNDNLFTDQNYLGDGIYRVPPELACTTATVDTSGMTTKTVDAACVAQATKAQLRIRTEIDDGLRFWIQLDADHDEPIGVTLRHDELAVTVNLDDAGHAMIAIAEALGDQAPNASLAGQLTADVKILGFAHAIVSLTFDRPIAIAVADQGAPLAGPTATRFASAAATVASIELDGNAPLLVAHLGLGETTAHISSSDTGDYTDLDLPGATADATFNGTSLALTHVSLGTRTTTLAKNGVPAITIDLDASDGRSLSAAIDTDTAGVETVSVSPRFDLQIATDHGALGDTAPVYDVTRVLLDGSLRGDVSSQLEVLSGSLAVTTSPAHYGFAATAGQCVTSQSVTDAITFASYTQFAVSACR